MTRDACMLHSALEENEMWRAARKGSEHTVRKQHAHTDTTLNKRFIEADLDMSGYLGTLREF